MASTARVGSRRGAALKIDTSDWIQVDPDALEPLRREQFLRRRQAITLYLQGDSAAAIKAETGLSLQQIYRTISTRCLATHADGTLMGWRGALPYQRLNGYKRKTAPRLSETTGAGASGALSWIFEGPGGPDLEKRFRQEILGKRPKLESARRPKQALFNWLIKQLRAAGLETKGEWPFNAEKMGYVSICRYIDRVMDENPLRKMQLTGGPEAERKARAGDGADRPRLEIFQRVEADAHKIDARMVLLIPSPHGGYEARKIHRVWVIVLVEVASRAVLGYHLSFNRECTAEDVLRAIKCALSRWTPRELQFSEHAYAEGAGLPSWRHDSFVGACWDEFSVDGALANICSRVERQLREVVMARIIKPQDPTSYTSRRSKDDRPFVESFFRTLTKASFHRLSTTTGSKPQDKRGADPDAAALETQFQLEYAEELLDTVIANYNATPHSGLGYRSPLQQMEFLARKRQGRIRQADPTEVRRMVGIRDLRTLKGGIETGRRPYFNFAGASYSAEWLRLRTDLIGKLLWLHIEDENDARVATVSSQRGEYLGTVRAAPPWHRSPHTLYMRRAIRALDKNRRLHLSTQCDAVEELIRYAESSEGKKLAPHPAYLEARRVLQQYAEQLAGEPMVARVRDRVQQRAPDCPAPETDATTPNPPPTTARSSEPAHKSKRETREQTPKQAMPRMKMAKVW